MYLQLLVVHWPLQNDAAKFEVARSVCPLAWQGWALRPFTYPPQPVLDPAEGMFGGKPSKICLNKETAWRCLESTSSVYFDVVPEFVKEEHGVLEL